MLRRLNGGPTAEPGDEAEDRQPGQPEQQTGGGGDGVRRGIANEVVRHLEPSYEAGLSCIGRVTHRTIEFRDGE